MKYPWALAITYVDEANNMFLALGGAAWKTKLERDENLSNIPVTKKETDYVLDIESPRGIEDDRYIEVATVEQLLRRPIGELIADARQKESAA